MQARLRPAAATIKAASAYVVEHHRHAKAPQGGLFAVFVERQTFDEDGVERWVRCGAGIAGRPVSRHLQAQGYIEMIRITTDGTPNAASFLLGTLWRAARVLGWKRAVTYTLLSESGISLIAAGWRVDGDVEPEQWGRAERARSEREAVPRIRWVIGE